MLLQGGMSSFSRERSSRRPPLEGDDKSMTLSLSNKGRGRRRGVYTSSESECGIYCCWLVVGRVQIGNRAVVVSPVSLLCLSCLELYWI